jgi:hypothetical protein
MRIRMLSVAAGLSALALMTVGVQASDASVKWSCGHITMPSSGVKWGAGQVCRTTVGGEVLWRGAAQDHITDGHCVSLQRYDYGIGGWVWTDPRVGSCRTGGWGTEIMAMDSYLWGGVRVVRDDGAKFLVDPAP